jgi:cytochrome bd ubiquinol oxidase subunit II
MSLSLNAIWFVLVGVLLTGYAILDGFDLGVGMLHLFTRSDHHRRVLLNAIGPVWDGNEVWLVVGGGALFAAFPHVYATVFSGFYTAFMLLLCCLIFRAVAIEFRSKRESASWRSGWDISFSVASFLIALLMGVALGNIVTGIPLGADKEYQGGFFNLLNPYALVTGVATVALFMMHGAIYLALKTEGELQAEVARWVKTALIFFGVMFGLLTMATFVFVPQMADKIRHVPWLFVLPTLALLAIANIPREITQKRYGLAFVSSCCSIAGMLALFGLGMFPNLVPSNPGPEFSLNIYNAASSQLSLKTMLTIAIIGMPFVSAYTIAIYWVFRGKVDTAHLHY